MTHERPAECSCKQNPLIPDKLNSHFPIFWYEECGEVPRALDADVEEGVGDGVAQLDLHLRGLQVAHGRQAQDPAGVTATWEWKEEIDDSLGDTNSVL